MSKPKFSEWQTRRDPTVTHWCLSWGEVWQLYKDPDVQAVIDKRRARDADAGI